MSNLVGRLKRAGLKQADSILDFGCGVGVFLQYLEEAGYRDVAGYDPYMPGFSELPVDRSPFDCVVANDVIEHCPDPREMLQSCRDLLKPGGLLYVSTVDVTPVDLADTERHLMCLHQPFHRVMYQRSEFAKLCAETGMEVLASYDRSYMDTLVPFVNRRFLGEFNRTLGDVIENTFDPTAGRVFFRKPALFFFAFFGYFSVTAFEPAIILRKPK